MTDGGGRLDENDRRKMEQREKQERKNNVIITGIGGIRGRMIRKGDRGESERKVNI
jgi:hypothetical protein